jgi:hypothetical protein
MLVNPTRDDLDAANFPCVCVEKFGYVCCACKAKTRLATWLGATAEQKAEARQRAVESIETEYTWARDRYVSKRYSAEATALAEFGKIERGWAKVLSAEPVDGEFGEEIDALLRTLVGTSCDTAACVKAIAEMSKEEREECARRKKEDSAGTITGCAIYKVALEAEHELRAALAKRKKALASLL